MGRRRKGFVAATAPQSPPSIASQPVPLHLGDVAVGAVVAALTAILYDLTAARDFVLGDTPELMTVAVTLGVAHPPGYPLFTMLGHLFSLVPVGSVPLRVNLLAAVCGTGTVLLIYLTALRLSGSRAASACAALVLAVNPLFWTWSLVAEVFPLNNLLAAGMIYLLVIWYESPERMGFLITAAFVSGLALANQQTIVLTGPAVLFLLLGRRRELLARPRILAYSAVALAVGLLPYAYLPWAAARHPLQNWGDPTSAANFLAVITRKHFGSGQLVNAPQYQGGSALDRIAALGASFGVLAGLLLLWGAVESYRRRRWYFWFSLMAFLFAGPFFAAYANMNLSAPLTRYVLERFDLLPQVVLAPMMAFGLAALATRKRLLSMVLLLAAVAGLTAAHYKEIDQSKNHSARRLSEDILATLEPHSILVANGDEVIMPLLYLQDAEGQRLDVALLVMPFLMTDWYIPQLRRRHPDLVVPFERYDGKTGTLKALFDANPGRPAAVDGISDEASLHGSYWFYRRGLVSSVEPLSKDVTVDQMIADNEKLFRIYRPPPPASIKSKSLEPSILGHYATGAVFVGEQCKELHYDSQARAWFKRALALDPSLTQVADLLDKIENKN
jgi:hypothetical protein